MSAGLSDSRGKKLIPLPKGLLAVTSQKEDGCSCAGAEISSTICLLAYCLFLDVKQCSQAPVSIFAMMLIYLINSLLATGRYDIMKSLLIRSILKSEPNLILPFYHWKFIRPFFSKLLGISNYFVCY